LIQKSGEELDFGWRGGGATRVKQKTVVVYATRVYNAVKQSSYVDQILRVLGVQKEVVFMHYWVKERPGENRVSVVFLKKSS
jgi:hypothetical protein